ncbi:hypothetical protein NL108_017217 [Boleophthalmus pectinirostris]|nr:hypothetical protein NL108_017217 [Boleophthalmus pectinirostris]
MTDGARKHVKGIDPGYLSTLTAEDPRPFDQKLVISIDGRQITLFNPDKRWTKPNFWSESPTTWTNIHFGDIHTTNTGDSSEDGLQLAAETCQQGKHTLLHCL